MHLRRRGDCAPSFSYPEENAEITSASFAWRDRMAVGAHLRAAQEIVLDYIFSFNGVDDAPLARTVDQISQLPRRRGQDVSHKRHGLRVGEWRAYPCAIGMRALTCAEGFRRVVDSGEPAIVSVESMDE